MVIVVRHDLRYEDGATERFEGIYKDYKSIMGREYMHLWNLSHDCNGYNDSVCYYYKEFNTFEEYKKTKKWRLV